MGDGLNNTWLGDRLNNNWLGDPRRRRSFEGPKWRRKQKLRPKINNQTSRDTHQQEKMAFGLPQG